MLKESRKRQKEEIERGETRGRKKHSTRQDSNPRPPDHKACALLLCYNAALSSVEVKQNQATIFFAQDCAYFKPEFSPGSIAKVNLITIGGFSVFSNHLITQQERAYREPGSGNSARACSYQMVYVLGSIFDMLGKVNIGT